jgi:hypothetical protein
MKKPGMVFHLKGIENMLSISPKDETAPDQVVGEVTAHQAYNRYGP